MFTLSGIIKVKNDTQQVSDKFKKREFVVTDSSGNYPQDIQMQLTQDNVSKLDSIKLGDSVNVSFFIRGREWTNPQGEVKYFNSLDVWKIEKIGNSQPKTETVTAELIDDQDDDLPF